MNLYTYIYAIFLVISVSSIVLVSVLNYKNIEIYYWSISLMIPMVLVGYLMRSIATTTEGAIIGNNIGYIGGTLMSASIALCMMKELRVHVFPWFKAITYFLAAVTMAFVWIGSFNGWFYESVEVVITEKGNVFVPKPGPYNWMFYIFVVYLISTVVFSFVRAIVKRRRFSYRILGPYFVLMIVAVAIYSVEKCFHSNFEWITLAYVLANIVISSSYDRNYSHDIDAIVMNMHVDGATKAYVAFDMNRNYLGANEKAIEILPKLADFKVDHPIDKNVIISENIARVVEAFERGNKAPNYYELDGRIYKFTIDYFYVRREGSTAGFIFEIEDDTEQQKKLEYINNYNESLHLERDAQIEHIKEIQEKVVFGIANMIENRDNNTGGHVKRTSDVIRILVDTMMERHVANLDRKMAEEIIKAAPMHDLGKIAIDNSILLKPGKLTDEEYAEMKKHSAKSGEIVKSILEGVEAPSFVNVAYNVARYHHEKYDGSGYPEGLSGNDIPLEARIMAVADVYDALVSKRCYKEAMSFEKANTVMLDSMGSHFDPMLKEVFVYSRAKLEKYYAENRDE